jgi:hypothetical protein
VCYTTHCTRRHATHGANHHRADGVPCVTLTLTLILALALTLTMQQVRAALLVVTPSSPKVVLHLRTHSYVPPPVAASLLAASAASASPNAATPPTGMLAAPPSGLSMALGLGLGAGAGVGVGAGAGPCVSDEDGEDGEGDEGGEYPREGPSAVVYDPTYEPGDEEAAGIRKRQRPEQRSEPSQAARVHYMIATHTLHMHMHMHIHRRVPVRGRGRA